MEENEAELKAKEENSKWFSLLLTKVLPFDMVHKPIGICSHIVNTPLYRLLIYILILFLISAAPKQSRTVSIPLRRKNTSVSQILHTIGVTLLCIVVFCHNMYCLGIR